MGSGDDTTDTVAGLTCCGLVTANELHSRVAGVQECFSERGESILRANLQDNNRVSLAGLPVDSHMISQDMHMRPSALSCACVYADALVTLNHNLSSRSIIECCIFPILLYGAESWVLNLTLLKKLESFSANLVNGFFIYIPKTTANNIVHITICLFYGPASEHAPYASNWDSF